MICPVPRVGEMFRRARNVEALLFDVDGVFTDGKIIYTTTGEEIKHYDAHDGQGVKIAQAAGLRVGMISARESDAIRVRAADLKIEILYLGRYDKLNALTEFIDTYEIEASRICFMGDDLPDIPVLEQVGFPVAVQNAVAAVKETTPFHTTRQGGRGAVREVVEFILYARGIRDEMMEKMNELHHLAGQEKEDPVDGKK
ncbi:MAG: 3-deoxy-D-manno-octulosonate 8-phosphate phosphatase [Calditrichaeota bacterium]|nr:MAG: 3-deoxy-D-manno-octulosonate 8-phosphate phosphatase [Calditrichota bacterium]